METTTSTTTQAPVEQPKLYGRELADALREERLAKLETNRPSKQ